MVAFTVPEFEQLAMKNARIIVKMLKVSSKQLRYVHSQVQNLIGSEEQVKPEQGLYNIGEYYLKNKRYSQALYAFKRYLTYYPSGRYSADVIQKLPQAEEFLSKYGQGKGPPAEAPAAPGPPARRGQSPAPQAEDQRAAPARRKPPGRSAARCRRGQAVLQRGQPDEPAEVPGGLHPVQEDRRARTRIRSTPPRPSTK